MFKAATEMAPAETLAFENGQYRNSLEHLKIADRLIPGQPQVIFYKGGDLEALGRKEEVARACYTVLREVHDGPRGTILLCALGAMGLFKTRDAETAVLR